MLCRGCSEAAISKVFNLKRYPWKFHKIHRKTPEHLCQSLFFNNVAGPRPAILLKKILWHRCFHVNFAKFLRAPFFTEQLWWLLLVVAKL